ncbi:ABC transporter permease [Oryzicola mucosus]|uniref:ABC transporter permease n=1 Tax=Oryzicola mucosus TaxID=2767425 RepID=A0A8J6U5X3_9HYPH|nr:ABC transporter permease [Oryzicola mucosus]MBD0417175.1 ABC transporter permease [Oryzicola mucosus]
MLKFLSVRLTTSLIALTGVMVIVFFLARLTGSPASLYLPVDATDAMVEAFNRQNGLDKPLVSQFVDFVANALRLDFGQSIAQQRPAATAVLSAMPQTILLAAIAMGLTLLLAIPLGTFAALSPNSTLDRGITLFSLFTASIPDFWFALVCVLVFSVSLGLLPTSGQGGLSSWVLPVATVMLHPVGVITQVVRGAMLETLNAGYVQNARARGYSWRRLAFRHALRNAALPIITVAGDRAGGMVNGAVIVSAVFAWPGIGKVLVDAVYNRDFAVIQAGVFVVGIAVILLNILVDLVYAAADPRIRVS